MMNTVEALTTLVVKGRSAVQKNGYARKMTNMSGSATRAGS